MTTIRRKEEVLLDDLIPTEYISGETDDGEPIWSKTIDDIGPETPEQVQQILKKHLPYFPELNKAVEECRGKLSFRVPMDTINWFGDAASIDQYFLPHVDSKHGYSTKGIVLLYNEEYFGHVWYFSSETYPEFCGIYGMKSSLVNVLVRSACDTIDYRRGVAKRIMTDGVILLARREGRKTIIVPWPLPPMIPILNGMGFTEHNVDDLNRERSFLKPYTGTSNYFTLSID
jgi:hypothetical protein